MTYADLAGGERTLRLALWYPSSDASGRTFEYQGLFEAPDVWLEATPVAGPHPVAVFSHGHQGYAENSGFLMAHLASHGWLVAAPDHTGNTTFDGPDRATEIYFQRPADLSAVLDHLGAEPLADLGHVVGIGHSFGGYTLHAVLGARYDPAVLAGCEAGTDPSPFCSTWSPDHAALFEGGVRDPRLAAGISMGAGDFRLFGAAGAAEIASPTLIMAAEHDGATEDTAEPLWAALGGPPHGLLFLVGGGHQSYTDFAGFLEDGSTLDPAEGHRIVAAYTLAFARRHGLGDRSMDPVLSGEVVVSELAEVR